MKEILVTVKLGNETPCKIVVKAESKEYAKKFFELLLQTGSVITTDDIEEQLSDLQIRAGIKKSN